MPSQTYRTRHLTAGSPRPPRELTAPVRAAAPEPAAAASLAELRMEAARLGITVDMRWSAVKLRNKIAKAEAKR